MTPAGSVVDFIVRYAESEGALTETIPEGALLMLPQELGHSLGIPEELSLTEDPEVAREDGFVLVSPGDPLVRSTAETVLRRGDVGCSRLAWPQGLPPTPAAMEQLARGEIQPDHGRVDVVGAPTATHVMLLRVGALVTYSVSIDEQVQEVEEAWVVAGSGVDVPPAVLARLGPAAVEPGLPVLGVRWEGEGVGAADLRLRERAARRCGELARQTSARLASQLAVVDDYYQRVLESIDERRARAGEDRVPLLGAQADATRGEWARRRAEVADDLTPSFELRPFRLHLLAVPAYRVAALVRRGPRTYGLTLTFLPLTSAYLPPPCPACGEMSTLVAGKDRLGCRRCLGGSPVRAPSALGAAAPEACLASPLDSDVDPAVPPPADGEPGPTPTASPGSSRRGPAPAAAASRGSGPESSRPQADGARGASEARSQAARRSAVPRTSGRAGAPDPPARPGRASSKRRQGRVTPKGGGHATLSRTGMRLATSFWESVLEGERVKARDVLEHSPLGALLRLYGRSGPSLLAGLQEDELPLAVATSTLPAGGRDVVTAGDLRTSMGREVPFALRWRPDARPRLVELESFPLERIGLFVGRSDELGKAWRKRFEAHLRRPPLPDDDLDEVESALLQRAGCFAGLGYVARCLAARWYLVGDGEGGAGDRGHGEAAPSATAAAVEVIVARRLGWRLTTNAAADRYRCGLEEVRAEVRRAQVTLGDDPDAGW